MKVEYMFSVSSIPRRVRPLSLNLLELIVDRKVTTVYKTITDLETGKETVQSYEHVDGDIFTEKFLKEWAALVEFVIAKYKYGGRIDWAKFNMNWTEFVNMNCKIREEVK